MCKGELICGIADLPRFYFSRDYQPAWTNAAGPLPAVTDLISALQGDETLITSVLIIYKILWSLTASITNFLLSSALRCNHCTLVTYLKIVGDGAFVADLYRRQLAFLANEAAISYFSAAILYVAGIAYIIISLSRSCPPIVDSRTNFPGV